MGKRKYNSTEEAKQAEAEKDRQRWLAMTPEKRAERAARRRELGKEKAKKREQHRNLTTEERSEYNRKQIENRIKRMELLSEAKKEAFVAEQKNKKQEYDRERRPKRTAAQRAAKSKKECERHARKRHRRTPEEILASNLKQKRYREMRLAGMTPAQRERERLLQKRRSQKRQQSMSFAARLLHRIRGRQRLQCVHCGSTLSRYYLSRHIHRVHLFCSTLLTPPSESERAQVELNTRAGHLSKDWHYLRRGRITGTRAHRVICLQNRFERINAVKEKHEIAKIKERCINFARGMMGTSGSGYKSKYMKRGQDLEPVAAELYRNEMGISQTDWKYPVGLMVHPKYSYLAATPDAIVAADGCVEIKCPIVPVEKVRDRPRGNFIVKAKGRSAGEFLLNSSRQRGKFRLHRNHTYFTQVVMQLMCSDRQWNDFVVYYVNDENPDEIQLWRERITRKEAERKWNSIEPKMVKYFHTYLALRSQ